MAVALTLWGVVFHLQHPPADPAAAARRAWTLAASYGWLAGFGLLSWWYVRRQRRERAHWDAVLRRVAGD